MPDASPKLRIVFMGTPEFAVVCLQHLLSQPFRVEAVVTTPDKPAGRGLKMLQSPVKTEALKHGIEVLQPTDLSDPVFSDQLTQLEADVIVVVAFRKLPPQVIGAASLACFNLHASLLPQYRGAAPVQRAIMNGETVTGLTTFRLDNSIDTGKIIFQEEVAIADSDNATTLLQRMALRGAHLCVRTLDALQSGTAPAIPQDELVQNHTFLHKAPKISKEDCKIDWKQTARKIVNQIRGLSITPGAHTALQDEKGEIVHVKILRAESGDCKAIKEPGTIETDNKSVFRVYCSDGCIAIKEIQPAGKRNMTVDEYLRGSRISNHWLAR